MIAISTHDYYQTGSIQKSVKQNLSDNVKDTRGQNCGYLQLKKENPQWSLKCTETDKSKNTEKIAEN